MAEERRGNGMVENQVVERGGFKHEGVLIEGANLSGQFDAIEQVDGNVLFPQERAVKKRLLDVADGHVKYRFPLEAGSPAGPKPKLRIARQSSRRRAICPIYNYTFLNRL